MDSPEKKELRHPHGIAGFTESELINARFRAGTSRMTADLCAISSCAAGFFMSPIHEARWVPTSSVEYFGSALLSASLVASAYRLYTRRKNEKQEVLNELFNTAGTASARKYFDVNYWR